MTINYYTKNNYGTEAMYLATGDDRQSWYNLTGKKTIDRSDMSNLSSWFKDYGVVLDFNRVFEGEV